MIARVLWAGIIAGLIAGGVSATIQLTRLVPLILAAETYETAAAAHHHAAVGAAVDAASAAQPASEDEEWEPKGLARTAFTVLFNILAGVGYGLLLVAGMTLSGRPLDARAGLLWGLAGFVTFAAAPALGLPPELPGMPAAELVARQTWWIGTAVATASGIATLAFAPSKIKALGILLMLAPHVIGAPAVDDGSPGAGIPAGLAAHFVAASLFSALLFWLALGAAASHLLSRRGVGAQ